MISPLRITALIRRQRRCAPVPPPPAARAAFPAPTVLPESWSKNTRIGGYHLWSSATHCHSTVAGHTISVGSSISLYLSPARNAAICIVFPRPISSPMIPPVPCRCSSHNH